VVGRRKCDGKVVELLVNERVLENSTGESLEGDRLWEGLDVRANST
jgi:hypothetical protein